MKLTTLNMIIVVLIAVGVALGAAITGSCGPQEAKANEAEADWVNSFTLDDLPIELVTGIEALCSRKTIEDREIREAQEMVSARLMTVDAEFAAAQARLGAATTAEEVSGILFEEGKRRNEVCAFLLFVIEFNSAEMLDKHPWPSGSGFVRPEAPIFGCGIGTILS